MAEWRRHAIYFAPPARQSARRLRRRLARLGSPPPASPATGLDLPGLPRPRAELVAGPDRYGFHATLKPPFRLADGPRPGGARRRDRRARRPHAPFALEPRPRRPRSASSRCARPRPSPALAALAGACVTALDRFRAPPTPEEIARRRATGLDPVDAANLARWGYPWVLDRFRFHMTLTRRSRRPSSSPRPAGAGRPLAPAPRGARARHRALPLRRSRGRPLPPPRALPAGSGRPAPRTPRPAPARGEPDRVDPHRPRSLDVGGVVVDEDAVRRREPVAVEAEPIDRRIGLHHPLVPGDHHVAEARRGTGTAPAVSSHFAPEKLVMA